MLPLDAHSLESVYRRHGPVVLRRARQIMGNDSDAQEVLHDVFTSLIDKPQQFSGTSSIVTFLHRMTTNCALGKLRQSRNRLRLVSAYVQSEGASSAGEAEASAMLREMLDQLPEQQGQLCVYYFLDEMSQAEIAELMDCSRQWIGKQLLALRQTIAGIAQDPPVDAATSGVSP